MADLIPFRRPLFSETYKAMANARHREMVAYEEAGETEAAQRARDDVRRLDEQATHARRIEDEHRRTFEALNGILELAERADAIGRVS